ncbi:NAD-dependent protein deacetylase sirtuin-1-like [Daphnia pulicaria]|uniref:NAD-dependent protein deacetylase sirtuin-1-like n=1 Tax=Daphnia pulicaria TaxID=35523 RepID=UPI001EECE4FF|nr:NAD-dependent protein deacetylase sirtuin-1-like [Daphnia pulicaria]
MADEQGENFHSPVKRSRTLLPIDISQSFIEGQQLSNDAGQLGSCEMFNAGDSGFSELTSLASSEDENLTNDLPSTSYALPAIQDADDSMGNLEKDDDTSSDSDVSDISGLSDLSNHDWEPSSGTMSWVQQQMLLGTNPRTILNELVPNDAQIPTHLDDVTLWKIIVNIVSEPPRRERLRHINAISDAVRLLRSCKKILVLTGAGVSVSCGIPDFRSRDGIYARLAVDFPDLPDPQAMFDIHYFRKDPRPFFKFARDLWPGQFTPSKCHKFIRLLEKQNKLLRNYTQNIDTLEQQADIERVIQCHGSFATATCLRCQHRVPSNEIEKDIMEQRIPLCPKCSDVSKNEDEASTSSSVALSAQPIMKPDIVFFGEGMPDEFHRAMVLDKEECDLIIVIGSSLKVRPVALIPCALPNHVPQILINREPLRHMVFDVELLGDCDIIVNQLCHLLGTQWKDDICYREPLTEISRLPPRPTPSVAVPAPIFPKRDQDDPLRRDSGMSTGSLEMESAESADVEPVTHDMTGWWEPRIKVNLADQLPENTYLTVQPGRYLFPGAELFYDPDEEVESDSDSSSDSSDSSGIDGGDSTLPFPEHGVKRKAMD